MSELTDKQQNENIKKMKKDLKQQKNTIEKLEKKINFLLDQNKLKKKSKIRS
jgi:hypothetical protein